MANIGVASDSPPRLDDMPSTVPFKEGDPMIAHTGSIYVPFGHRDGTTVSIRNMVFRNVPKRNDVPILMPAAIDYRKEWLLRIFLSRLELQWENPLKHVDRLTRRRERPN
jgi:hypothetical protein